MFVDEAGEEGPRALPEDTDVRDCPAQWGSFGSLCHCVVLQTLVTKAGFTMIMVRRVTTTLSGSYIHPAFCYVRLSDVPSARLWRISVAWRGESGNNGLAIFVL